MRCVLRVLRAITLKTALTIVFFVCCCAVTHSGMTLAPLVGQLVADEVLAALADGSSSSSSTAELLAPYKPSRQFRLDGSGVRWADATKPGTS